MGSLVLDLTSPALGTGVLAVLVLLLLTGGTGKSSPAGSGESPHGSARGCCPGAAGAGGLAAVLGPVAAG
ncbi:hypothetical protein, partial [Streptomyces calidiresistens]